ncbi:hypothetical protein CPJCM30710_09670 [Clostridium polyendosporum]|uniref:DUF3784 domain-containing protein n=1 Tax=Clostridium polyendosporum TaxID=69208 RepID=A0A919RYZ3_9CLOT|nr:hypothetical protein [Clostridium polyendosporum]GIM28301.1 hypothetical protein CPJCM30710_09670 [Clostridium polyendosporum]
MRTTTLVLEVASILYMIFGIVLAFGKGLAQKLEKRSNLKDSKGYVKFIGRFNIILGIVGVVLGILDFAFPNLTKVWIITFLIIMMSSSLIQNKLTKKYI